MRHTLKVAALMVGVVLTFPVFAWKDIVVKKTDSLNFLAEKYHPAGVSSMDMVIAIRNSNPSLLESKKGVRPGMHLRIPTTVPEVRQAILMKPKHSAEPLPEKKIAPKIDPQIAIDKATIASLQQGLNNQMQTIATDQTQITNLTAQLNAANQAALNATNAAKSMQAWSLADVFLPLWVVTLILYFRLHRKYRAYLKQSHDQQHPTSTELASPHINEPIEPELVKESSASEWQQVELDIPESDIPVQTHIPLEPLLTSEEKEELVGEQQNIINAISNDHDNIDWHMALLEFYAKTNNENGFTRHQHNMLRSGLMQEGDGLWEMIRKIYLNRWVYRTGE